jgi:hypothetical protein
MSSAQIISGHFGKGSWSCRESRKQKAESRKQKAESRDAALEVLALSPLGEWVDRDGAITSPSADGAE